jgi:hypothetical protein
VVPPQNDEKGKRHPSKKDIIHSADGELLKDLNAEHTAQHTALTTGQEGLTIPHVAEFLVVGFAQLTNEY